MSNVHLMTEKVIFSIKTIEIAHKFLLYLQLPLKLTYAQLQVQITAYDEQNQSFASEVKRINYKANQSVYKLQLNQVFSKWPLRNQFQAALSLDRRSCLGRRTSGSCLGRRRPGEKRNSLKKKIR